LGQTSFEIARDRNANTGTHLSRTAPAVQTQNYWSNLLNAPLTVPNLAKLNGYFRATAPLTKSGNDCNAPLILATTP